MHAPVVTAYRDWLAGVTSAPAGVNALLALVPRLAEDAAAPTPIALFADPYRVANASDFGQRPSALPALYILPDGPVTSEGEATATHRAAKSVAVAVRVILETPNVAAGQRYAAYVLRAIEQSTALFLDDGAVPRAARVAMGVQIISANAVTSGSWHEAVGEAAAVAVFAVDFSCRDTLARG